MSRWWLGLAARDLARRPLEAALLGVSLALLSAWVGAGLLATQAAEATARALLEPAPDLVVRRVSPQGFVPMPERTAAEVAARVVGPTRVVARIWGVVEAPSGPVTVVATTSPEGAAGPDPETARVGPGLGLTVGEPLVLGADGSQVFAVASVLPPEAALVDHDLVLLAPARARELLGLGPEEASDLALWVFHPEEVETLIPDLRAALPWPVQVTTKDRQRGLVLAALGRAGGTRLGATIPALLALLLLGVGAVRDRLGRGEEMALLSALGWTGADVVRLQLLRGLLLALPAVVAGLLGAYLLVLGPGADWTAALLWPTAPPLSGVSFDSTGAAAVLLQTLALVLFPWAAVLAGTAAVARRGEPGESLQGRP